MKRIFLTFLILLCLFFVDLAVAQSDLAQMPTSVQEGQVAQTQSQTGDEKIPQKTTDFPENWEEMLPDSMGGLERTLISIYKVGYDWQKENPNLKGRAEEAKEINHPLSALYLMTYTEANPITGLDGYGKWQETPFGRMRLVSCDTGLKKNKAVYVAVQMQIHPRLALTKPKITLKTPVKQSIISYPIMYPLPQGWTRTQFYFEETVFPIFFEPLSYEGPLTVQVQVDWTALNPFDNVKASDVSTLDLTLQPNAIGETGLCGYMMTQLQAAPAPVRDNAEAQAIVNEKGEIQLFFKLAKSTKILSVQIDEEWTFTEVDKKINDKVALLVIKPSKPISEGTVLPIKLITSFGIFDVPTTLQSGDFKTVMADFSWTALFIGGVLLFLATPLFAYFLLNMHRTAKQLEKSVTETLIVLASVGTAWSLGWQAGLIPAVDLVQLSPIMWWFTAGWLVYWILNPRLTLAGCLFMVIFLPKPYLNDVVGFAGQYALAPLGMGLLWTVMVMWPFTWIKRYPKAFLALHKLMKKEMTAILWFARLPALFLLIWLIVGGSVNGILNQNIDMYTPERVKQALAEDKAVVVSVENPVCFSCMLNKIIALNSGAARSLRQQDKLTILQLPADTTVGKHFMQRFGQVSAPVNIMFGPKNGLGIVAPDYLHALNTYKYLNAVR